MAMPMSSAASWRPMRPVGVGLDRRANKPRPSRASSCKQFPLALAATGRLSPRAARSRGPAGPARVRYERSAKRLSGSASAHFSPTDALGDDSAAQRSGACASSGERIRSLVTLSRRSSTAEARTPAAGARLIEPDAGLPPPGPNALPKQREARISRCSASAERPMLRRSDAERADQSPHRDCARSVSPCRIPRPL